MDGLKYSEVFKCMQYCMNQRDLWRGLVLLLHSSVTEF